ncbi:hypothetical protein K5D56_08645 [Pseudomonas cichorii]|nr:hypothetical protein [Pseudomonas cichorii]MBX8615869.1 hypothetical protein [Pseudomonas cichorii]
MLSDDQARESLKTLMIKYLKNKDPEADRLIGFVEERSRQVPIRGVLERIKNYDHPQFTKQELEIIEDMLYAYG